MNFGKAIELLKEGKKVARNGWNGKKMWLILIDNWTIDSKYTDDVVGLLPVKFVALKTVSNDFIPWNASQADMLAEDWQIVD